MKKKTFRLLAFGVSLLAIAFSVGCQTAEGFGRDLQGLGERIEDRAR